MEAQTHMEKLERKVKSLEKEVERLGDILELAQRKGFLFIRQCDTEGCENYECRGALVMKPWSWFGEQMYTCSICCEDVCEEHVKGSLEYPLCPLCCDKAHTPCAKKEK